MRNQVCSSYTTPKTTAADIDDTEGKEKKLHEDAEHCSIGFLGYLFDGVLNAQSNLHVVPNIISLVEACVEHFFAPQSNANRC